jgi:topoisomerase IV subunit A
MIEEETTLIQWTMFNDDEQNLNADLPEDEQSSAIGKHFYENQESTDGETIIKVTGMYKDWFLDYASYVILERAVPAIEDGFKPVQRRIMHSMKELQIDFPLYTKKGHLRKLL